MFSVPGDQSSKSLLRVTTANRQPVTILAPMFATVPPPPQRLLVFARLPELGRVKTRLAVDVGPERALQIYEAMLRELLGSIGASDEQTEVECLWAPSDTASGPAIRRAFPGRVVAMQAGITLGDRLAMAFSERFFFHRTDKIIAIGVDDPLLPRDLLDHAFALLDSVEYVLGPASDGGYYLIGCRAASYEPEVFQDIAWGTATVLASTVARISSTGRTMVLLPERFDIDTAEDLERYAQATGWQP